MKDIAEKFYAAINEEIDKYPLQPHEGSLFISGLTRAAEIMFIVDARETHQEKAAEEKIKLSERETDPIIKKLSECECDFDVKTGHHCETRTFDGVIGVREVDDPGDLIDISVEDDNSIVIRISRHR